MQRGVTFVAGPEGGITLEEKKKLLSVGGQGVLLHAGNVLRSETASIIGLGTLSQMICAKAQKS